MKILLSVEDPAVSRILVFGLEAKGGHKVMEIPVPQEAIKALGREKDIDLIVCEGTDRAGSVVEYIKNLRIKTPVVVCIFNEAEKSGTFGLKTLVGRVSGGKILDDLLTLLPTLGISGIAAKASSPSGDGGKAPNDAESLEASYCRINTNLLLRVSPLKNDIYIRLSAVKYIRLFQEGDVFDAEDLKRYLTEKKVDFFYLKKTETGEFLSKLADELTALLTQTKPSQTAAVHPEVTGEVVETVQGLIQSLGMTPEVQKVVKTNVQLVMKAMGRSPKLSSMLGKLKLEPHRYIASHSVMLGELACSIAAAAGWNSEATFYKLTLAAMLHDLAISNQNLATVQTMAELEKRAHEFTPDEIKLFPKHPQIAAEWARELTEVPPDVDVIIAQHHERPDGSGFPRGLGPMAISPMGAAFCVAHDLLVYILKSGSQWSLGTFLKEHSDQYASGNFKKVIKVMAELKL